MGGLFLTGASKTQAGWPMGNGTELSGFGLDNSVEMIRQETQNLVLARMKQKALKQTRETVAHLVTGSQTEESMVVDPNDYYQVIYGQPYEEAETMLTNYFNQLRRGVSDGERDKILAVENELKEELFPKKMAMTLGKVVSSDDPIGDIFADGTMDGFEELYRGINHPDKLRNNAREMAINYFEQTSEIEKLNLIVNQGFKPQNGIPGRVIADIIAASETAPIEMIANASSPQQVETNLSTSMLTTFMRTGYEAFTVPGANQARSIGKRNTDIQRLIYAGQLNDPSDNKREQS